MANTSNIEAADTRPGSAWREPNSVERTTHEDKVKIGPVELADILEPDILLYLGTLMLDESVKDIRTEVKIQQLVEQQSAQIKAINAVLSEQTTTTLADHFKNPKTMKRTLNIIVLFAKLGPNERLGFIESQPDKHQLVTLQILSNLPTEDLGYWHRLSHNNHSINNYQI